MNLIKRIFRKLNCKPVEGKISRPSDWKLTIEDLLAEMDAGKRKSIGHPEIEWAREYKRSLIPENVRFPKKGDLYESKNDQTVDFMTAWKAPFTGGGEATLFKGERIWVDTDPSDDKPIGVYALPIEYDKLEKRMVPTKERKDPCFGGFYFSFDTIDLNENFTLIQTEYDGKAISSLTEKER